MVEVARLLLDAGASPNTTNGMRPRKGYRSAIYGCAGIANNPAITSLLLERGADPDDDETVYHAVYHPDHSCLRLLVEHGAQVDGTNALPAMIGGGDVEGVRLLLSGGADPGRPFDASTAPIGCLPDRTVNPLPAAAADDSAAVIEALLSAGADPNMPGRDGRSPVRRAMRRGKPDVVEVLLHHGAVDDISDVDRFLGACLRADRDDAQALLGALQGGLDDQQRVVIVDAAEYARLQAVGLMLELGFAVDVYRKQDGATALHAAAYQGRADVVQLLLFRGADVNQLDLQWHSTALAWATVGSGEHTAADGDADWVETIQTLLDAGSSTKDAWVESKPPSDEVAAHLIANGIFPAAADDSEVDDVALVQLESVAAQLRAAFDTSDLELLGSVLHDDVRWGGGPAGCHNRNQVLDWYQALYNQGVQGRVTEQLLEADAVMLGLALTKPAGAGRPGLGDMQYQVFRVADGLVVEIWGLADREDAVSSLRRR
jgi:ankyrin repeat protein